MPKMFKFVFADSDPGAVNAINGMIELLKDSGLQFEVRHYHFEKGTYSLDAKPSSLEFIIDDFNSFHADFLFVGTSVESSLEYELMLQAKRQKVKCLAIIDHWVNYQKRFERNGHIVFPEMILVNDKTAFIDAIKEGLPKEIVYAWGNPWWYLLEKNKPTFSLIQSADRKILFLSDNMIETWKEKTKEILGYTEFEVLEVLIEAQKRKRDFSIEVRLHPKDHPEKYDAYINRKEISLSSSSDSLGKAATSAWLVVGMFSNALIEAAFFNPHLVRLEPNRRINFLPVKSIKEITSLTALDSILDDRSESLKPILSLEKDLLLGQIEKLLS